MRNLSSCRAAATSDRRGSAAGLGPQAQQHAKYKVGGGSSTTTTTTSTITHHHHHLNHHPQGLISTPGYCKFSAWRRESDVPKQPFSRLILSSLAAQPSGQSTLRIILIIIILGILSILNIPIIRNTIKP